MALAEEEIFGPRDVAFAAATATECSTAHSRMSEIYRSPEAQAVALPWSHQYVGNYQSMEIQIHTCVAGETAKPCPAAPESAEAACSLSPENARPSCSASVAGAADATPAAPAHSAAAAAAAASTDSASSGPVVPRH